MEDLAEVGTVVLIKVTVRARVTGGGLIRVSVGVRDRVTGGLVRLRAIERVRATVTARARVKVRRTLDAFRKGEGSDVHCGGLTLTLTLTLTLRDLEEP